MSTAVALFVAMPGDYLIMGTPTLAALIMMLLVVKDGYSGAAWARLGLHHLGLRYWAPALILPALTGVFALVATVVIGTAGARTSRRRPRP